LFNVGPIEINITWLITFFSGVLFGFILMMLIYLVAVITSLNKEVKRKKVDEEDIDEKEIQWLIKDAQNQFKDKEKREAVGYGSHLLKLSIDLSHDISRKFYPESKYPYLELTIDEFLLLMQYVSNRFNELLNKPILKFFKGMTLRRLVSLKDAKDKIDENLIVKTSNKFKLNKLFKGTMMVLNAVNPVYWFRRLVLDNITNVVMIKLGLVVLSLIGEETYKIYSKKVFNTEKELDSDIESIYKEIEELMKEDGREKEK
jgi:hypothetical protein